jgi:8-oxo-dGTP pyrophosphatase MutT (NUDIX family)
VLLFEGKYVLQLRDDKPGIAAPGQWCLFGGLIKPREMPRQAILREIDEELSIRPSRYDFLWHLDYRAEYEQETIRTWFFEADVTLLWPGHVLREGQDAGIFGFPDTLKLNMPRVMRETINRHEAKRVRGHHPVDGLERSMDLT